MKAVAQATLDKAHKRFSDYMAEKGAVPEPSHTPFSWRVETAVGTVRLSMHRDDLSIFVRFDDPAKAKPHVGGMRLNPFSGKWNWRGLTPRNDPFAAFKLEFDGILEMTTNANAAS